MGASILPLLMAMKRRGYIPNGSAVIEIGAQQLDESFVGATDDIAATGRFFGVTNPPPLFAWTGARSDTNKLAGAPLAREFWTWLGLSYSSIDIDGSPGSIPLDLNYDEVPTELIGKYDVVTNFGTTEHVANQLQSFKIVHDLATPGGLKASPHRTNRHRPDRYHPSAGGCRDPRTPNPYRHKDRTPLHCTLESRTPAFAPGRGWGTAAA
jgi:hypothetical protein